MTWTAGVTRATGDLITAAIWNNYLGAAGSIMETAAAKATAANQIFVSSAANTLAAKGIARKYKGADEIVNNSITLQNDNDLVFAIAANATWLFWGIFIMRSGTVPDFKFTFTAPAGASGSWHCLALDDLALNQIGDSKPFGTAVTDVAGQSLASDVIISFGGVAVNGGTAGDIQLQWAQNVADVSDTKVLAYSFLLGLEV